MQRCYTSTQPLQSSSCQKHMVPARKSDACAEVHLRTSQVQKTQAAFNSRIQREIIATTHCCKCLAPCSANCCKSSCIRFPVLALLAINVAACLLAGIKAVKARPPCTSMRRTLATTSINAATYVKHASSSSSAKLAKKHLKNTY